MIRLFDSHADTPYELWVRKETLTQNSCHIDSMKAKRFSEYRQILLSALSVAPSGSFPEKNTACALSISSNAWRAIALLSLIFLSKELRSSTAIRIGSILLPSWALSCPP